MPTANGSVPGTGVAGPGIGSTQTSMIIASPAPPESSTVAIPSPSKVSTYLLKWLCSAGSDCGTG